MISEHLDKNNLHHAYLIEGTLDVVIPIIKEFVEDLGIKIAGNPDFCRISVDSFRIEDARNLKSMSLEKSFFQEKKIFFISANNFLPEAQNALLKILEEPTENTHFFLVVPDANSLLRTFTSRFYVISNQEDKMVKSNAEKFITMKLQDRINFLKEFLKEAEESDESIIEDSVRSKAIKFLNALETVLYRKTVSNFKLNIKTDFFVKIFNAREFLRQSGSSVKNLMESVALTIPIL
jgi:DNA polymerase III delta prime subunit